MMNTQPHDSATVISKAWSFCTTLRDDGVGYDDYLEQLLMPTKTRRYLPQASISTNTHQSPCF